MAKKNTGYRGYGAASFLLGSAKTSLAVAYILHMTTPNGVRRD